ncbi:MAG: DUF6567 family protein [Bacteroidota bacterium]
MKKSIIILFIAFIFGGCAVHSGYVTNSAALSTNNFAYVKKSVQGTAKATYFLGFGGLSSQALVEDARKDLLVNFPLQDNQALVNITVSFKTTGFLVLFKEHKCTVSASVVQFNPVVDK